MNVSDGRKKPESNCLPCEPQRVPVDPHYYTLFNDPPATLLLPEEAKLVLQDRPRKGRIAIVTFLLVDTMEISDHARDSYLPLLSHRECYCLKWGYDCHVELLTLDKRIAKSARSHFNKLLTVRKYLPFYEWVFFADADSFFIMERPIENLIVPGKTIYFQKCELHVNSARAGYFLMKNTPASYQFLEDWYDFARDKETLYCNGDAGVLNLVLLNRIKGYDGSCLQYVKNCTAYRQGKAKDCTERFLTKDINLGEISLDAAFFIAIRLKQPANPGQRVAYHGKTLAKDLVVNMSALYDCTQYLS